MTSILIPGFLKWDGLKFVLDPDVGIEGPPGPAGPAGATGLAGPIGPTGSGGGGGGGGLIASSDFGLTPIVTFGDNATSGLTVAGNPLTGSAVTVYLNGVVRRLGNGVKTDECYFSSDGGVTAKSLTAILLGDTLYWNGIISGINLSVSDRLDFFYLKSS